MKLPTLLFFSTFYFSTCPFILFAQTPAGFPVTSCSLEDVDLHIFNGVSDFPISDVNEWEIGAVTVANKNDTDGDLYIDGDVRDVEIITMGDKGENNDKDFIRIRLERPLQSLNNETVELTVTQGSSFVNIWQSKDKKEGKALKTYKCKDLPKDLYIEATNQSSQIRDIEIRLGYKTKHDKVRATAIWIGCTQSWSTRCAYNNASCDQTLQNPVPNAGILANLDQPDLANWILTKRNSIDGSRYGHGLNGVEIIGGNPKDNHFGGRILFEFSISPSLSLSDYDALGITFDCTRRRNIRQFFAEHGDKPTVTDDENFPTKLDYANDDEELNKRDEDNIPNNGYIYCWDAPTTTNIHGSESLKIAFKALKMNFEEYVRVGINEIIPDHGANGLLGSRASDKFDWHTVYYTKSGSGNILEADNAAVSYSFPKKGSGNAGNGSCTVELLSMPLTDGYKLTFNGGKWRLKSTLVDITVPENPTGKWIITDNNKVKVTLTKGSTPFYNGDNYMFSIFKTANMKVNETGESFFNGIDTDF